jgi:hypothetical protein
MIQFQVTAIAGSSIQSITAQRYSRMKGRPAAIFDNRHGLPGKTFVWSALAEWYRSKRSAGTSIAEKDKRHAIAWRFIWRLHGDSNPGTHRERVMS